MKTLQFKFVEFIPEQIDDEVLYISTTFCTAIHKCVCGCGNEVVTPLSPTDWELTFDGKSVSLSPSIGNWSFKCQSHYFIIKNEVRYAKRWDKKQIDTCRNLDFRDKQNYYRETKEEEVIPKIENIEIQKKSFWYQIRRLLNFNF